MKSKLLIIVSLFVIQAVLYFINAVTGYFAGVTYGVFGNAFVYAGIMGFIAYVLYFQRNKHTYFAAIFFSALTLIRSAIGIGLSIFSNSDFPISFMVLSVIGGFIFGIVPIFFLLNKEIRTTFLNAEKR